MDVDLDEERLQVAQALQRIDGALRNPGEVGDMYERRNQTKPVSGSTGLWSFPGFLLLGIGPIVWFVKTNGALNNYWRSLGAR